MEAPVSDWRERLRLIVDMMREMSRFRDPQEMVRAYGERVRELRPIDGRVSLSRRGLAYPWVRITRSTAWRDEVNPWKEKDRLPLIQGGLLAELIYANEPRLIEDFRCPAQDPAAEYLGGFGSLLAIPMFDDGEALNMVILLQQSPRGFPHEQIPEMVWQANLFGRATSNLVMSQQLREAYQTLDQQMKLVGEIQKSLLPARLPAIPALDLAAYYQPSQRAGGDYYDFFPLPNDQWGIFIADVSGHGTPAAVLMAVTHSIAHTHPGPPQPPHELLAYLNGNLSRLYTASSGSFVTAFYAIFCGRTRTLTYASAGHPPPRLKRCSDGSLHPLNGKSGLALGILADEQYRDYRLELQQGDQLIFYTDGVTEAARADGAMFGVERLDEVLENCSLQAQALLDLLLQRVDSFVEGQPADDDRTVIVARVR